MFTKYGYVTLGIITIIVFIVISLSLFLNNNLLKIILIASSLVFLLFSLNFFRDPDRKPPAMKNAVLSPADGKVLLVKEVEDHKLLNGKAIQVSIFMSCLLYTSRCV